MPRATLTKTVTQGSYPTAGVLVTWTAADAVNLNQFIMTGAEVLLARNSNAGSTAYTVTISSAADAMGRTKDITTESIAAGTTRVFGPFRNKDGWVQSGGYLNIAASNAEVLFAVLQLGQ